MMSRRSMEETGSPGAPDEADAPPPYDSLSAGVPHCVNASFSVLSGEGHEEGTGEDLPPPYSPGLGVSQDVFEAPPHYYSLFGQLREARREADSNLVFAHKVLQIFLNTIGCTILMVVFMSIPISVLVMGAIHTGECPIEPYIPIFLIVGGSSGVIKNVILILESLVKRTQRLQLHSQKAKYAMYTWRVVNLFFNLFMLSWVIAGSYWVYHVYDDVNDTHFEGCDELLYKFSFGILTCSYILLVLMLTCICCCGLCLRRRSQEEEEERESEGEREGRREEGDGGSDEEEEEEGEGRSQLDGEGGVDTDVRIVLDTEHAPQPLRRENGVTRQHSTSELSPLPPPHLAVRYTRSWEPVQLNEYAASPVFSPTHGPRSIPAPQDPVQPLYTTLHLGGYSCTSV